ncbi:murein biosynthesis integral membrane protein MurJ [Parvibium lacunae]|uniref:Probable lipid II flippase MurJ n=1 Tax=Parvibium lacunae TaxID=1888893 RepID=A0A368L735_9BURK|nr:murein biosynthesis integral membrane protein MurJ [Parvibium lacunae]RCS59372.1 murein biosynthesis integral membrane protein MurJ [Parvibium lacunae]
MNLLKAAAAVSSMTLLSRITGLIRENLIARLFGAGSETDAFFVAFRLPNLLRRLFAEGAFSQAFVPILAEYKATQPEAETKRLVNDTATVLFWAVLGVSVIGVIAADALVLAMASGLGEHSQGFDLAVSLTRWMFPYILCATLMAFSAGVLNTWKQFSLPAFAPVLLNLSFIAAALWLSPHLHTPIYALAVAVLVGGVLQVAIQIPALRKVGMLPRITWRVGAAFADPGVRRVLKKMGPAIFGVSVAQISLLINTNIASHLAAGSVSWITYADRLMEFPTAMLGVALGTVLLPSLSRASKTDPAEYNALLDWGLRLMFLLALPATVGLCMLAEPLTAGLFHYGRFSANDVAMTQQAVMAYGVGLCGLIGIKILAPGFYARQDLRTPVKIAVVALITTQLFNWLLVPTMAHAGLALSISVGACVNALLLFTFLCSGKHYQPCAGWLSFFAKLTLALVAMAGFLWWVNQGITWVGSPSAPVLWWLRLLKLGGLIVGGAAVYFAVLLALGFRLKDFKRKG